MGRVARSYYTVIEQDYVYGSPVPSMTVLEQEPREKFSGLYDVNSNKLYTVERSEPIGFIGFKREP